MVEGGIGLNDKRRLIFCLFLVAGVILSLMSGFSYFSTKNFMKTATSTTAIIEDIETYTTRSNGKRKTHKIVHVSHEVDGKKYTTELNEYNASMRVGQRMTVYYQKGDPYDVRTKSYIITIIPGIMGVIFIALGIITNVKLSMSRKV